MSSRERLQYKRALQNLQRERLYGNPMTLEEAKSNKKKTILEQGEVLSGAAEGAATGALMGLPFGGPVGSAVGSAIGGAIGGYNAMQDVPGGQATVDTARVASDAARGNFQAFGQMISQLNTQLQQVRTQTTTQLQQLRQEHERVTAELRQQLEQLQQQNQQLQQQNQQARRQAQQTRRQAAAPAASTPNVVNPVPSVSGGPKPTPGPERITERKSLKDYL